MKYKQIKEIEGAYIAHNASVMGDVVLKNGASIWYGAVVRGDNGNITIGENSNIQDNCTVHMEPNEQVSIGDGVSVGHNAVIHGCRIGDDTLIGMGAVVLSGARIGSNCIVGAGALVTGGTEIPDGMMALGSPAKAVRPLKEKDIEMVKRNAAFYANLAKEHFGED